jgi:anti-sigma regulatory factor (Ser/Thr protein kinase)
MEPNLSKCSLVIPSNSALLSVVRTFVESFCHTRNLERRIIYAIVLATGEAVSNVVRHAHRNRPDAKVQVHCRFGDKAVEIHIVDEGPPFDLTTVPELDPAEIRLGGRGVYLMRALMDELLCQPLMDRGNVLRMVKRLEVNASSQRAQ